MGMIHPSTAPGDVSVNTVVDRSSTLLASTNTQLPFALGFEQVLGARHLRNLQSKGYLLAECGNSQAFVICFTEVLLLF